jgi:hypothetical protein
MDKPPTAAGGAPPAPSPQTSPPTDLAAAQARIAELEAQNTTLSAAQADGTISELAAANSRIAALEKQQGDLLASNRRQRVNELVAEQYKQRRLTPAAEQAYRNVAELFIDATGITLAAGTAAPPEGQTALGLVHDLMAKMGGLPAGQAVSDDDGTDISAGKPQGTPTAGDREVAKAWGRTPEEVMADRIAAKPGGKA